MMKAVVQNGYGSPDEVLQLREIDKPVAEADEVLVRVRAASVHPDVWHIVTGRPYVLRSMGAGLLRPKDRVPGTDLAGQIVSVGKDVMHFKAGDEVFGESFRELQWKNGGTFAEYAACKRSLSPSGIYVLIGHDHFGQGGGRVFGSLPRFLRNFLLSSLVNHLPDRGSPLPSKKDSMAALRELLASAKLTPVVDRTFPLSQVPEAIRYLAEGNPRGRIVVTP